MQTATQFHEQLSAVAAPKPEIRRHSGTKIHGHQGDVYIHRIGEHYGPNFTTAWRRLVLGRQVAVGDTVGSRHIAEGDGIQVFWADDRMQALKECPIEDFAKRLGVPDETAAFLLGPMIIAEQEWALTHPEHAHHVFPPGSYLTTYQLDRRTMRVVRD